MIKEIKNFKQLVVFLVIMELDLPIISETNTITNAYNFKVFKELYENNVSTFHYY